MWRINDEWLILHSKLSKATACSWNMWILMCVIKQWRNEWSLKIKQEPPGHMMKSLMGWRKIRNTGGVLTLVVKFWFDWRMLKIFIHPLWCWETASESAKVCLHLQRDGGRTRPVKYGPTFTSEPVWTCCHGNHRCFKHVRSLKRLIRFSQQWYITRIC